jgi:hypothetical protein
VVRPCFGDARTELFVAVVAVIECFISVFYESDSVDDSHRRRTSAIAQAVAMWGLTLALALFWGAIPLTFHIHKLDSRIPAWAKRRNVFTTALIALSVPLAFVSVYLAWFVIMTLPSFYGLSNKFQKRIFSSKSERLAGV